MRLERKNNHRDTAAWRESLSINSLSLFAQLLFVGLPSFTHSGLYLSIAFQPVQSRKQVLNEFSLWVLGGCSWLNHNLSGPLCLCGLPEVLEASLMERSHV